MNLHTVPQGFRPAGTIATRLDQLPLTGMHALILGACAIGFLFDLFELSLGGALSAIFSPDSQPGHASQLSLLLAAAYLGAIVGAPTLGWCADEYGRQRILTYILAGLGLASFAAAISNGATTLIASRLLAGFFLGAYPPLMIAYVTDILPPARRGFLIMVMVAIASLGAPAGLFLIRWLTPSQPFGVPGWRWAFVVGGAGAGFAAFLFATLPESPRWLAVTGRTQAAEAAYERFTRSAMLWALPANRNATPRVHSAETPTSSGKRHRANLILIACLFFLSPWATVAFPLLSGAVFMAKGFTLTDTLLYLAIASLGPVIGTLLAAPFAERFERRTSIALCAIGMGITVLAFAAAKSPLTLVAASVIFSILSAVFVPALSIYAAELFPTRVRGAASATTWAVNRASSALALLLLLPLLQAQGSLPMFTVIAATLAATVLLVLKVGPRGMTGRPVD